MCVARSLGKEIHDKLSFFLFPARDRIFDYFFLFNAHQLPNGAQWDATAGHVAVAFLSRTKSECNCFTCIFTCKSIISCKFNIFCAHNTTKIEFQS